MPLCKHAFVFLLVFELMLVGYSRSLFSLHTPRPMPRACAACIGVGLSLFRYHCGWRSQQPAQVHVAAVQDGTFIVSFKSAVKGLHEIAVTMNGHHVADSPRLILMQR